MAGYATSMERRRGRSPLAAGGWLVAGAWLLAAGCEGQTGAGDAGPQRFPVDVVAVRSATLEETIGGIGSVEAVESVVLRPEAPGILRRIGFAKGDRVEAGQLLFELDDAILRRRLKATRAALRSAETRLRNARRRFERQQQLRRRQAVSEAVYDDALAAKKAAAAESARLEAEIDLIRERIADTHLRAPFAGVITEPRVDAGAWVRTGQDLATLYRTDALEVAFSVPARHAERLQPGQAVHVAVDNRPDERITGELVYIDPQVDPASRNLRLKAELPAASGLKPGAFVSAQVVVATRRDRPVLPEEALVATRTGYILFAVQDGRAQRRSAEIGLRRAGTVEITEGAAVGDRVVRRGHMRLIDGAAVRVRASDGGAGAKAAGGSTPGEREPTP